MRKDQIHREALRLFAEHGVEAVSMRQIADAVGIREGGLYRHISSKDELARDVFQSSYGAFARRIEAILEVPVGSDAVASFPGRIRALVDLIYAAFDEDPVLVRFLILTQHRHLPEIAPGDNPVIVLARAMVAARDAGVFGDRWQGDDVEIALAILMGVTLQPLTNAIYGRLPADRMQSLAPRIARAVLIALEIVE